MAINMYTASEL